eukprot:scaffold193275_cov17-Prasinocladus_malaysianus.AAC.2
MAAGDAYGRYIRVSKEFDEANGNCLLLLGLRLPNQANDGHQKARLEPSAHRKADLTRDKGHFQ